jgi:hypothetical protein
MSSHELISFLINSRIHEPVRALRNALLVRELIDLCTPKVSASIPLLISRQPGRLTSIYHAILARRLSLAHKATTTTTALLLLLVIAAHAALLLVVSAAVASAVAALVVAASVSAAVAALIHAAAVTALVHAATATVASVSAAVTALVVAAAVAAAVAALVVPPPPSNFCSSLSRKPDIVGFG